MILIIFIAKLGMGANMYFNSAALYRIDVPSYTEGGDESYFTNSYKVEECIRFVDEFKFERVLCNNFNIVKLK